MLLAFRDGRKLRTKKILFEEVFHARDPGTLEQLKELSSRRRVIEESINNTSRMTEAIAREMAGGLTSKFEQDLQKLECYLPLLENLIMQIKLLRISPKMQECISNLRLRWSSALNSKSSVSKLGGPKFYSIDHLPFELGMHLFLYGVILRERAFETLQTNLVETATILRKAAGVYTYLAEVVLPPLVPFLPKDRPAEATSSLCSVMSIICLADAQAVTAKKAEEKAISANLLSKLHDGVTLMLQEATSILKSNEVECHDVSSRLKELISTCSVLHRLRSQKYLAEDLRGQDQVGTAILVLRHALSSAKKAKPPRKESWKSIVTEEVNDVAVLLKKLERENDFVWHEKISDAELPTVEGKIIVNAIPYEPQRWERALKFRL